MLQKLDVCELSTVESYIRILGFFRLVYELAKRICQRLKLLGSIKHQNNVI